MTNLEKFIEVMNEVFDAGLTKENIIITKGGFTSCTPRGFYREDECPTLNCKECECWWDKEWETKKDVEDAKEKILPIPCTKVEGKTVKDWLQKINGELDELKNVILSFGVDLGCPTEKVINFAYDDEIAEEAVDTITAITSMLEAMGIDENMRQEAQRIVNEKNKERGRF